MARTGRYSHQLIPSEFYHRHAGPLASFTRELRQTITADSDFVAAWVIAFGIAAKGFEFLQPHQSYSLISEPPAGFSLAAILEILRRHKLLAIDPMPWRKHNDIMTGSIWKVLNVCELRGLPRAVRKCLLAWREGLYPLKLYRDVVSGDEVFHMQQNFRRCVTLFDEEKKFLEIHHGRDAWAFTIHDLIHAEHFYSNPESAKQQSGFHRWVAKVKSTEQLLPYLSDPLFKAQFDYLTSDMNAYCGHMVKTFHALIVQSRDRLPPEVASWQDIIANSVTDELSRAAFLKTNTPAFEPDDFRTFERYFEDSFNR